MSLAFGASAAGKRLIGEYGSPAAVLARSPDELFGEGKITEYQRDQLGQARRLDYRTQRIISLCRRFNWQILTPENEYYPAQFRSLPDMPPVVYVWGDMNVLTGRRYAAVVGTRSADRVTLTVAYRLGKTMSECGVVTVSGGAAGIDRASHEGAMAGNGQTVCVLGTGLGVEYLPENDLMRRRISENGAVITELPPAEKATKYSFPRRNRLIAALGETLTVVQSGLGGGSMISAELAFNSKKALFVLSGNVFASPGCEQLIAQKNAAALENAATLPAFYGITVPDAPLYRPGEPFPRILDPLGCTPEEFAALNGVREAEAYPLYLMLKERAEGGRPIAPEETPPQAPPPKKAQKKKPAAQKKEAALPPPPPKKAAPALTGDKKTVYDALGDAPTGMDSLAELTGLPPGKLMSAVTLLELDGLIEIHPGNRISIK